jgi:hypothetical protein
VDIRIDPKQFTIHIVMELDFPSQGRVDDNPQRRPAAFLIWFMNSRLSCSSTTSCTNIRQIAQQGNVQHTQIMSNQHVQQGHAHRPTTIPALKEPFTALAIPASDITPTGV